MGNARSQQPPPLSRRLLCLIRRSWAKAAATKGKGGSAPADDDCSATDLSSAATSSLYCCSSCKECGLASVDADHAMPPNAEELVPSQQRLRPPTYNPEDYATALRRWGRRVQQQADTLPSSCSSSSGYASAAGGEMTLRQFTSVSELLNKLRADLRLAFPSFVQEFAAPPAEGIALLLETLRGVQLSQTAPPVAGSCRRPRARRAALDELGCVECLAVCLERSPEAARSLAQAQPGLLALAVCLTSSLNRSRVLALQLLTRVCQASGGHAAVSEAVSTLRLRYGEGGRFRFLAGALLAAKAATPLRLAGVSFLNAFISSAPKAQTKLYIQAEACEAGLEPRALHEWLKRADDPVGELLREEVLAWSRHCVDVDALQGRARRAEETCLVLSRKVTALQRQLHQLRLERTNGLNERPAETSKAQQPSQQQTPAEKKASSGAEDEGISFSERSSSPDDEQETTIDDVIEELRIIVKDAEEELHDWKGGQPSKARQQLRSCEETARMDRRTTVGRGADSDYDDDDDDDESAIVPAIIHPQPPRRAPVVACSSLLLHDGGSDSLLSASRLNLESGGKLAYPKAAESPFEISETVLLQPNKYAAQQQSNSLGSKQYSKCSNTVQRRTERRKYLRRCQSQEHVEKPPRVIEHIRKFESLNSFDERRSLPNLEQALRRSESFHQTRQSSSSRRRNKPTTKSLDRIDESRGARRRANDDTSTSFLVRERPDSSIFAGRSHDVLGLGRNRFNAGKYSGSGQQQQYVTKNLHRHVGASHRGKVTDMLSGLY